MDDTETVTTIIERKNVFFFIWHGLRVIRPEMEHPRLQNEYNKKKNCINYTTAETGEAM